MAGDVCSAGPQATCFSRGGTVPPALSPVGDRWGASVPWLVRTPSVSRAPAGLCLWGQSAPSPEARPGSRVAVGVTVSQQPNHAGWAGPSEHLSGSWEAGRAGRAASGVLGCRGGSRRPRGWEAAWAGRCAERPPICAAPCEEWSLVSCPLRFLMAEARGEEGGRPFLSGSSGAARGPPREEGAGPRRPPWSAALLTRPQLPVCTRGGAASLEGFWKVFCQRGARPPGWRPRGAGGREAEGPPGCLGPSCAALAGAALSSRRGVTEAAPCPPPLGSPPRKAALGVMCAALSLPPWLRPLRPRSGFASSDPLCSPLPPASLCLPEGGTLLFCFRNVSQCFCPRQAQCRVLTGDQARWGPHSLNLLLGDVALTPAP